MKKNLQTRFSPRQYMLSRDFELYYYNDSTNITVDVHTHSYYEFYIFLEGNAEIELDSRKEPMKYGDVILVPPGIPHRSIVHDVEKPYRRFVFWLSQEYADRLKSFSEAYGYVLDCAVQKHGLIFHNDILAFNTIQSKILRTLEEIHSDRFGKSAAVSLAADDLVLQLNRTAFDSMHIRKASEELTLYESLLSYIDEHLDENLSLNLIADHFFVSKFYAAHLFQTEMGLSIHQYITKKRLAGAKDAILAGTKITEAYLRYGFCDYSSFFRAFKKEYGLSPKEFREMSLTITGIQDDKS